MSKSKAEKNRRATQASWQQEWSGFLKEVPPRPAVPTGMPSLRQSVLTPRGQRVDTSLPVWRIYRLHSGQRKVSVNIDLLYRPYVLGKSGGKGKLAGIPRRTSVFSDEVVHAMVLFLARSIEKHGGGASAHAVNEFAQLERHLAAEGEGAGEITPALLTKELYQPFARSQQSRGCFLRFYRWCVAQEFPGYSIREALRIDLAAPHRRHPSGAHIRSSDPRKGALTADERVILKRALQNPAHSTAPWDRALVWLLFELGCRVSAIGAMRNRHLVPTPLRDAYSVHVPRVKQRKPVKDTVVRKISKDLGDLLVRLKRGTDEDPLFPTILTEKADACAIALRAFVTANDLRTPRLNIAEPDDEPSCELLPLTSYRLRYTMATVLAEEGVSPETIAAMLDDRTLSMALVYTSNTSELVELLGNTLDRHPSWLRHVNLFLGKVSEESVRPLLPRVIGGVPYFDNYTEFAEKIPPIGWCSGNMQVCEDQPPLGCYRCALFIADPDPASHIVQLKQLTDELESKVGVESDRMAKVLRPDLLAIKEVITLTRGGPTNSQHIGSVIARQGEAK